MVWTLAMRSMVLVIVMTASVSPAFGQIWKAQPDDRHAIVATDTSGWNGPTIPMQGPRFFDAVGMRWWYEYRQRTTRENTFTGYPRLYMYWRANPKHPAERIQAEARAAAEAYPGQTIYWAISNEPNEIGQANQKAADYARIYYHYHKNLKLGDPKCRIMGAGILNWDHKSKTVYQEGKLWYEEFRKTWHDTPELRAYSEKHHKVAYPPQDVFNFHAYDLRGVADVPFAPEDWRYSRDQIEKCHKDICTYPEVLNKKIWLTEFGGLRAPTMHDNVALCRQLVGWMRDQPYIERWFWFILHSDKYGNWPKLELLNDDGTRTVLGDAARELALLPRHVKVDPINSHYEKTAIKTVETGQLDTVTGIIDADGDHPLFRMVTDQKITQGLRVNRVISVGPDRLIRKVVFDYETNYDNQLVRLFIDRIDAKGKVTRAFEAAQFGHDKGSAELVFGPGQRVTGLKIGLMARDTFTYQCPPGDWRGEIRNLVVYSEPALGDR